MSVVDVALPLIDSVFLEWTTCRTLIHILALVKEQLRSGHVMVTSAEGCKADSVTDVGHMQIR